MAITFFSCLYTSMLELLVFALHARSNTELVFFILGGDQWDFSIILAGGANRSISSDDSEVDAAAFNEPKIADSYEINFVSKIFLFKYDCEYTQSVLMQFIKLLV